MVCDVLRMWPAELRTRQCSAQRCLGRLSYNGDADNLFVVHRPDKPLILTYELLHSFDILFDKQAMTWHAFVEITNKHYEARGLQFPLSRGVFGAVWLSWVRFVSGTETLLSILGSRLTVYSLLWPGVWRMIGMSCSRVLSAQPTRLNGQS